MTATTITRRAPRTDLDRALSADLLTSLAAARRKREQADAQIRLLLAYGLEFAPTRLSVTRLARTAGRSARTLRSGRAYTPADIARLSALLGRAPARKED